MARIVCGNGQRYAERDGEKKVVTPVGFEPTTVCLEGRCSIHLSYGIKATKVTRKMANPKADLQYPVGAAR